MRVDLLEECAQQLGSSKFEFEVLLGASVSSVWQALGRHVARQLSQRKGVSLQQLGKFGFYKSQTSMLHAAPVFLLADRFTSSYGVVWRHRSSPAPFTATAEVNMTALGNDAGLGSDQTRRALEAVVTFMGKKLLAGEYVGKLALPGVGTFTLDEKALSFTFSLSLLRVITQNDRVETSAPLVISRKSSKGGASDLLRTKTLLKLDSRSTHGAGASTVLQRSMSLDGELQTTGTAKHDIKAIESSSAAHEEDFVAPNHCKKEKYHDVTKRENRRHQRKSRQELDDLKPNDSNTSEDALLNGRQILPRFLIPEPRVPPEVLKVRPAYDQVVQAAFQREVANIKQEKRVDDQFNEMQAARQRVVQIRDLQRRAEQVVARRELNAFLNNQIEVKRSLSRHKSISASRCDDRETKILPLQREVSDDMKRAEKQKLNQRLNEQVAAKAALKKDRRTLDQAESAYFISKLKMQDDVDRHEFTERKRLETAALLAGWSQQKAIRAQMKTKI